MAPIGNETISACSEQLITAEKERRAISPLTEQFPELTVDQAYAIQLGVVKQKIAWGERVVGHKIGLTSKPMQQMLGVNEPDYGHLFRSMWFTSGETVSHPLIQPRVEPEIAFVLKEDLRGPGLSMHDVLRATDYVVPALEIIDSRIANWKIKLVDTVADNASSGCFVLGGQVNRPTDVDLAAVGMVMRVNGEVVQTGAGAAVLGHPALGVAWLANKLAEFDIALEAGHVILSGSVSAAVTANSGAHFFVSFGSLGTVEATFAERGA